MSGSTYLQSRSRRKPWGLGVVVLLHLLVFWAIQAGLTRDITRQMPQVVQAILLAETPPPQPPAPKILPALPAPPLPTTPPPKPKPQPAPNELPASPVTPSPAYVPLKEVPTTTSPTDNSIANITTTNGQPVTTATGTGKTPTPSPSPPTPAIAKSEPVRTGPIGIYCEKPSFPTISRRMEEEGSVTLNIFVNVDGNVSKINIEKSSGFKRLDEAARNETMRWRFKPATLDGKPVEHSFMKTFNFKLDSDSISNQSPKEKDNPPC